MENLNHKHTATTTGAKVKRVINELEANFNSIREKDSTATVAVANVSYFNQRKDPIQHSVQQQSTTTIPFKTSWVTSTPVTTQAHATQTSIPESPRTLSFKTVPVPSMPKVAMNMDSDSSFHEKPVVPLTTVSVSTCPSCGSENVSSSNGARRSASFQHLTTSKVNCNGHNRRDPMYSNPHNLHSTSMSNVHRSRSFNCNLATSVPNLEPDISSNSCDCHCKCLTCRSRQNHKRQAPNRYTSHYQHLNHHQYQPISNYRRHKQGKKRKQPSFRHSSVYPLTLDPILLEKQHHWNGYCCQECVSSGSHTTSSNLIHPRCNGQGISSTSYFPLARKSSSYQLHHDDALINPISTHRTWKGGEKRLNSSGIYRDYRYWDVDEWRAQLKKERAKRKERAALMAVSALGIIIFICVSYFGTLLFLRITKLP